MRYDVLARCCRDYDEGNPGTAVTFPETYGPQGVTISSGRCCDRIDQLFLNSPLVYMPDLEHCPLLEGSYPDVVPSGF